MLSFGCVALLGAGCFSDDGKDDAKEEWAPGEQLPSTERLERRDDGSLFDKQLGIACQMTSWDGREAYCVPAFQPSDTDYPPPPNRIFADAACSSPVAWLPSGQAAPSYTPADADSYSIGCTLPDSFFKLGEAFSGDLYWGWSASDCNRYRSTSEYPEFTAYRTAGRVPLSTFVKATLAPLPGTQRLRPLAWTLEPGAWVSAAGTVLQFANPARFERVQTPLYEDTELDIPCAPSDACDGTVRCTPFRPSVGVLAMAGGPPGSSVYGQTFYPTSDAACTKPLAWSDQERSPACIRLGAAMARLTDTPFAPRTCTSGYAPVTGSTKRYLGRLGPPGGCTSTPQSLSDSYFELGAPLPVDTFAEVPH